LCNSTAKARALAQRIELTLDVLDLELRRCDATLRDTFALVALVLPLLQRLPTLGALVVAQLGERRVRFGVERRQLALHVVDRRLQRVEAARLLQLLAVRVEHRRLLSQHALATLEFSLHLFIQRAHRRDFHILKCNLFYAYVVLFELRTLLPREYN
jgi:hypothetical protein